MPYNKKTHKIGFDTAVGSALGEPKSPPQLFPYVLGDTKFVTTQEIPSDILIDMKCQAGCIMDHPYLTEDMKRHKIEEIFHRGSELAISRKGFEVRQDIPPLGEERELKKLEDVLIKSSCPLVFIPDPMVGILDHIKEDFAPDESIELKLPNKHKTVIQL